MWIFFPFLRKWAYPESANNIKLQYENPHTLILTL